MRLERFVTTFGCATLLSSAPSAATTTLTQTKDYSGAPDGGRREGTPLSAKRDADAQLLARLIANVRAGIPPELAGKECMSFGNGHHRS
jgi:hypothetical protein